MRFSEFEFFMLNVKYFIYLYWQLLAGQLENQVNVTDPSVRSSTQTSASRTGVLLHNLGAFLLELGRTTITLRLGQTPVGLSTFSCLWHLLNNEITCALCVAITNFLRSRKQLLTLDLQFSYPHLVQILLWFRQCSHLIKIFVQKRFFSPKKKKTLFLLVKNFILNVSISADSTLCVQPLPFPTGTSFGAIPMGSVQPGSGLVNGIGTGFLPRRIDIQIRRGTMQNLCMSYLNSMCYLE